MTTKSRTEPPRRFIEYARVSKVGERDPEELKSPHIQVNAMDAYAKRHNIAVIDRVIDLDKSGRTFEQRAIKDIIARIKNGEANGILVWKWSRWGRNVEASKVHLRRVVNAGGEVIAVTEDIDQKTAIGKFQLTIQQGVDEFQSDNISEGWKAVQRLRIEAGLTRGGAAPFGYVQPERKGEPLRPHPVNGPIVTELYARYLRGAGAQMLAKWLNDQGITTNPRRSKSRGDDVPVGRPFSVVTVQRLLDSGFAAGFINTTEKGKRRQRRGKHEALIDETTWQAYQRERASRRRVHPKIRQPKWHLSRIAVCGLCGSNLILSTLRPGRAQALCSNYRNTRQCPGVWVNRATVDWCVDDWLADHLERWATEQDSHVGAGEEHARLTTELEAARAEEAQLDEGARRTARLVSRGQMTEEAYLDATRDADAHRAKVTQRIDDLLAQLDALAPDADVLDRLERHMITDPHELNVVLRKMLTKVVVSPDTITVEPRRGITWVYARD